MVRLRFARLRFWWMCVRFDTPRRLRRAWRECVATWQDWRECGDLGGHLAALAGVLSGHTSGDSADWRPVSWPPRG